MPKKLLTIGLVIVVIFAGYLGLAFVLRTLNPKVPDSSVTEPQNDRLQPAAEEGATDQELVGSWDTGCLVPDPDSPWAERHTFTIKANSTGSHQRSSGESCGTLAKEQVDNFNFTIPAPGQIDLAYTSGLAAGGTMYDIYQVSGDTLKFGHGFCNCTSSGGKYGESASNRMVKLNDFLEYKKQ